MIRCQTYFDNLNTEFIIEVSYTQCLSPEAFASWKTNTKRPITIMTIHVKSISKSPPTKTYSPITECQKHLYFTYLIWRLKFIAPHKLCLDEEGRSWHPFINLSKSHCCVRRPIEIFHTLTYYIYFSQWILLKSCTEHGCDINMLCVKFP